MKTFKRSYLPDSIEYNGKKYIPDHDSSTNIQLGIQIRPRPNSIKVVVTNPRLKGKTDLHGKPYPSSTYYFIPYESPEQERERVEREKKNNEHVKFWVSMFEPRTKKWCRDKMRELKNATVNSFNTNEDEPDRIANQIRALQQVLSN